LSPVYIVSYLKTIAKQTKGRTDDGELVLSNGVFLITVHMYCHALRATVP
jgi:hypothetical protein